MSQPDLPAIPTDDQPAAAGLRPSRRLLLGALGLGAASLTGAAGSLLSPLTADAAVTTAAKLPNPWPRQRFVKVRGREFTVGGHAFRFGGTNNYYLHEKSHYMIDSVLNDAHALGLPVVRAWAFFDDPEKEGALQTAPYVYDEANFDSLDYAVYKAGTLGIRLVLPLVNNWPDYGGMQQYVTWFLGLTDDSYAEAVHHDHFYTDADIRACYKAYARHVIGRRNRYTGLRYRDDPTIMTWELANEPRNRSDKTGAQVLAWADEMSRAIKRYAPRQLVAVGDEGMGLKPDSEDYGYSSYEGNRWLELSALPAVDYATVHLYPQGWGFTADPVGWGDTWISDHLKAGKKLHKPVVIEEFGLAIDPARGVADTAARDQGYDRWLTTVERLGGAGTQFWILTARTDDGTLYGDYDGYRVVYPSDTATLLAAHARALAATAPSRVSG